MSSPEIPQIEDLSYVMLQALGEFGEAVPYRQADDRAVELLGVAYDDPVSDGRLRERLGAARTALKKAGTADNRQRGYWEITEMGRGLLALPDSEGADALAVAIGETYAKRTADPRFLADARASAEAGSPLSLTPRKLIEQWNVSRRGAAVNQQIHDDLAAVGLTTIPEFSATWIDGPITLQLIDSPAARSEPSRQVSTDDVSLSVGSLESANRGVESVRMDDSLIHAQSVMMRYDYSQLAVLSGPHRVRGAISWESIARERLRNPLVDSVGACMVKPPVVEPDDHLLDVVPDVAQHGFVLVHATDRSLAGIITMADLSIQFAELAYPFVLIGEIERWFRKALDSTFDPADLADYRNPDDPDRDVESAANLTLGEMIRVIENRENWDRLGWVGDRTVFVEAMGDVRRIRNETMHFSPDPMSLDDIATLRSALDWIRHLMET